MFPKFERHIVWSGSNDFAIWTPIECENFITMSRQIIAQFSCWWIPKLHCRIFWATDKHSAVWRPRKLINCTNMAAKSKSESKRNRFKKMEILNEKKKGKKERGWLWWEEGKEEKEEKTKKSLKGKTAKEWKSLTFDERRTEDNELKDDEILSCSSIPQPDWLVIRATCNKTSIRRKCDWKWINIKWK